MLSRREYEVLSLVAWDCLSCKEIADRLCISTVTVQNHIQNIKLKEHLSKMTELSKIFFVKYYKNLGALILLAIFSTQVISCDDRYTRNQRGQRSQRAQRSNRQNRSGRKYEMEMIEIEEYDCDN